MSFGYAGRAKGLIGSYSWMSLMMENAELGEYGVMVVCSLLCIDALRSAGVMNFFDEMRKGFASTGRMKLQSSSSITGAGTKCGLPSSE
jgi:hypothetical protein